MTNKISQCLQIVDECICLSEGSAVSEKLKQIKEILSKNDDPVLVIKESNRVRKIFESDFCFSKIEGSRLLIKTSEETIYANITLESFMSQNPKLVKIKRGMATLTSSILNLYPLDSRWYVTLKGHSEDISVSRNEIKKIKEAIL